MLREEVASEDGLGFTFTSIRKADGVGIITIQDQSVLLVEQYRHIVGSRMLELPGGRIEERETPEEAARRELAEECGFIAGEMMLLGSFHPFPSLLSEKVHIFYTENPRPSNVRREASEGDMILHAIKLELIPPLLRDDRLSSAVDALALYRFLHARHPQLLASDPEDLHA